MTFEQNVLMLTLLGGAIFVTVWADLMHCFAER